MNTKRVVLKENVTEDLVRYEAFENRWRWWNKISRTENTPYELVYIKHGGKTSIHYIEDFFIEMSYILAKGEEVDLVISEAKNSFDCYSWQEILNEYATSKDTERKVKLIRIAGVTAPYLELDPEYKKFFDLCLKDENSQIRMAVILAMGYTSWPEWKDVLRNLQQEDLDAEVRQSALKMLESFERVELQRIEVSQQEEQPASEINEVVETRKIEDLQLNVPVIVDDNFISDSLRVKSKLEDGLIKEICLVIGTSVTAELVENHIKYIKLMQELAEFLIKAKGLKNRFEQWRNLYTPIKGELDSGSVAWKSESSLRSAIETVGYVHRDISIVEKLEENVNKFNHFGGNAETGILGWTAKLIQEKVPEIIQDCMDDLCLWAGQGNALDIVAEDPEVINDAFYDLTERRDFVRSKLTKIEQTLDSIEKDPELGYYIKWYPYPGAKGY
ncbi:MAG: HEAT repeat domain-containing protein [Prochloraceae cyanobacterium]